MNHNRLEFAAKSFKVDPMGAIGMFVMRLISAVVFGVEIVLIARMLNSIISTFSNRGTVDVLSFLSILGIWLVRSVSELLYKMAREHVSNSLSKSLSMEVLAKKQKIQYSELEKKENWDLMERVQEDPSKKWMEGYQNLLDIAEDVIRAGWILVTIATTQWIISMIVVLFLLPYGILAVRNGQEEYTAYEESTRHFRVASYFRTILSNRENAGERILFQYQNGAAANGKKSMNRPYK